MTLPDSKSTYKSIALTFDEENSSGGEESEDDDIVMLDEPRGKYIKFDWFANTKFLPLFPEPAITIVSKFP